MLSGTFHGRLLGFRKGESVESVRKSLMEEMKGEIVRKVRWCKIPMPEGYRKFLTAYEV